VPITKGLYYIGEVTFLINRIFYMIFRALAHQITNSRNDLCICGEQNLVEFTKSRNALYKAMCLLGGELTRIDSILPTVRTV
jgi:hypothetical protein